MKSRSLSCVRGYRRVPAVRVAARDHSTILVIPFVGQFDIGLWYYPLMVLFTLFFVNAVNLTDGVDGLSSSVTFMVCARSLLSAA